MDVRAMERRIAPHEWLENNNNNNYYDNSSCKKEITNSLESALFRNFISNFGPLNWDIYYSNSAINDKIIFS